MRRSLALATVACLAFGVPSASAFAASCALTGDAEEGAKAATACKACHTLESGAKPRPTGPSLHDVFERKAGGDPDFPRYSAAMKAAAEGGLVWTADDIAEYVADPKAFLTKKNGKTLPHGMFFQVKEADKAAKIVAFLKAIKGNADCP